mmetsp:Transcript_14816/g.17937  ORF Transcript_14816/g.17937 Transcript_14816/m.17937 type:complete len:470 (+) Transcript_14816:837-2246(+)
MDYYQLIPQLYRAATSAIAQDNNDPPEIAQYLQLKQPQLQLQPGWISAITDVGEILTFEDAVALRPGDLEEIRVQFNNQNSETQLNPLSVGKKRKLIRLLLREETVIPAAQSVNHRLNNPNDMNTYVHVMINLITDWCDYWLTTDLLRIISLQLTPTPAQQQWLSQRIKLITGDSVKTFMEVQSGNAPTRLRLFISKYGKVRRIHRLQYNASMSAMPDFTQLSDLIAFIETKAKQMVIYSATADTLLQAVLERAQTSGRDFVVERLLSIKDDELLTAEDIVTFLRTLSTVEEYVKPSSIQEIYAFKKDSVEFKVDSAAQVNAIQPKFTQFLNNPAQSRMVLKGISGRTIPSMQQGCMPLAACDMEMHVANVPENILSVLGLLQQTKVSGVWLSRKHSKIRYSDGSYLPLWYKPSKGWYTNNQTRPRFEDNRERPGNRSYSSHENRSSISNKRRYPSSENRSGPSEKRTR